MGRPKRIQFAGACYYIELHGNNRQDIFLSNQDRRYFLSLLRNYKDRYELKVYAYCLMPNYVHLLIETGQPNLSSVMQGFNTLYTKYFNSEHNTSGHVFQGRYKALLVDKEQYLGEVTRSIHLNPTRMGMGKPWRYQWSSCSAYVESDLREPLVDSHETLKRLGKTRFKQSVRYMRFLQERLKTAAQPFFPVLKGLFIGNEAFADKIEFRPGSPPPAVSTAAQAQRILAETAAKHGVEEAQLTGRSQWRDLSAVRKDAIYRIWKEALLGVTEISRLFNRTPSAISQIIRAREKPHILNS